jgi:hypothetical protein
MQHIIKKQIIDLSVDKRLDAFRIQQKVSDYYFAKIVPLLQEAFDAASNNGETISIDSLVIDLGRITEKEIEKGNWEKKVFKNITEQLIPVNNRISSGVKVKKKASSLSISDQWIFYMRHGYLSWNVLRIDEDWYDKVLESFASDVVAISNLRNLINNNPDSARRIVFQNSIPFLKSIIETLTAENQDRLPQFINELAQIISSSNKNKKQIYSLHQKEVTQKLWVQALQLTISEKVKLKSGEIVLLLLSNNFSTQQLYSKKVKSFLLKNKIEASSLKQIIKENNKGEDKLKEDISTKELIEKDRKIEVNEDGIYLSNAGIVLLHPFLNFFFKNLYLVRGEDFIDSVSQLKALQLLHYLATGNTKPEEHELIMAKVLCARPLQKPVNKLGELTDEELHEADDLLLSAIKQWGILKGTSKDGLRESFLQRKGKLFTKNESLHLQVEQSSIDMLLDHLPWNLSIIKLPWMKDILKVEWR